MGEVTGVLVLSLLASVLGMFQFGVNTGVLNSPQALIEQFISDTKSIEDPSFLFSLVVSAFLVGGMVGGLSGGVAADRLGRKTSLMFTQILSLVGALLMGLCKTVGSVEMLLLGRLFVGLSCGLFTGLVPLYVAEVAPVSIRGALGTLNQLAVTSGILISQIVGLKGVFGREHTWPALLALATALPSLTQLALLPLSPESPRFLILNRGDDAAGEAALKRLRPANADIYAEVQQIAAEASDNQQEQIGVLQLLQSKRLRLQLVVTLVMHLSQQLSGIVAVFYYSTSFFIGAGIKQESAQYATIGVGLIMVTMTLITIPLMDRLGRRTLHLLGLLGIAICSALITLALLIQGDGGSTLMSVFLVASTLGFVVFFALGPGSIPWLITGELFTQAPRAAAASVATLVNWAANLGVGLLFPVLQNSLQKFSFVPFLVCTVVCLVVLYRLLPETKGKAVETIAEAMQAPNAWSGSYVRHADYRDIQD